MPGPLRFVDSSVEGAKIRNDGRGRDPAAIFKALTGNDAGGVQKGSGANTKQRWKSGTRLASRADFVAWARELRREIHPQSFGVVTDTSAGNEHMIFVDPDSGRVIKLTKPGLFGFHAEDAGEYLQRWALANRLLGDNVAIEGIVTLPGESVPRTVISQPFIEGRDATTPEVRRYLTQRGFVERNHAWIHPELGITITDAYNPANAIMDPKGVLHPIDWVLEPTEKAILSDLRKELGLSE